MPFSKRRRQVLFALCAVALSACGGGASNGGPSEADLVDMSVGPTDAPVVMIEYASSVCGACAGYHAAMNDTIKMLAAEGKIRFIFREYSTSDVDTAGFSIARCAGTDKYFDVVDDLFTNQRGLLQAARSGTVRTSLQTIAARHGLDKEQFETCLANEEVQENISNAGLYGNANGVDGTPSLFLNGVKLEGLEGRTPESLIKLVEEAGTPPQ